MTSTYARSRIGLLLTLLVAAAVLLLAPRAHAQNGTLRILTWEGLADDDWIAPFEEEHGVQVQRTYVGSNDEYMAKLAAGGTQYDTVVIVSSLAQPAIKAGFVDPVDLDLLPNFEQIYPEFRAVDFLRDGDTQYGVPSFWDIQPVTVNADVIPEGESMDILFNEEYAGRIGMWNDVSTIGDVAAYMGFEDLWNLTDEELEAVKQQMIEQKPLVRKYWSTGGEVIELFTSGEIVATNSWSYVTQALRDQGMNVRQFAPERPTAWLDSHFIVAGTENRELAHEFINYMLEPEVLAQIGVQSGFSVTNPNSEEFISEDVWPGLIMSEDEPGFRERLEFWQEIPERQKYLEVWNEVKAAPVD